MLKNILAVILGLFISISIIFSGSEIAKGWFIEIRLLNLSQWREIINRAPTEFFIILLASYALASLIGSIITAILVKRAKEAYAFLIGFILFIFSCIHIFYYKMPFWFEVSTFFIFFPASWIGGKLILYIYKKLTLIKSL